MAEFTCTVVTPETTVLNEKVSSLVLPLFDGQAGVLNNHSSFIGRLTYGELRFTVDGQEKSYYIDGGFAQVDNNVATILTGRVLKIDELDSQKAKEQLEEAFGRKANSPELMELRDREMAQARAQIRLVEKVGT
ncbi:MAG: ATP synthase F1 subunit epsilon [Pirellulaceae bacterium]|nr:ATP synthase F1 subunit epsilon [Pirellulaceae bacterium]